MIPEGFITLASWGSGPGTLAAHAEHVATREMKRLGSGIDSDTPF